MTYEVQSNLTGEDAIKELKQKWEDFLNTALVGWKEDLEKIDEIKDDIENEMKHWAVSMKPYKLMLE